MRLCTAGTGQKPTLNSPAWGCLHLEPRGEGLKLGPAEHDAEMWHGHLVAVDGVDVVNIRVGRREMRDNLVAKQVKVDPARVGTALAQAQTATVKGARRRQVVD